LFKFVQDSVYHLKVETGWSYSNHLKHSFVNSMKLIKISFLSLVHGIFPFMWKAEAPKEVIKLYHEIMKIEHIRKMDKLKVVPKNKRYS